MTETIRFEELNSLEVILFECTEDMPQEIKDHENWRPFMKKGWKTWTSADFYEEGDSVVILEDNHYEINFPSRSFKIIESNLKQKQ